MKKLLTKSCLMFLFLLVSALSVWATDVQIQAITTSWTGPTSDVEIRFFLVGDGATTVLRTPENQMIRTGTVASGTTTYKWDCAFPGSGQITIPLVTLPATTNAVGGGRVRWSAMFFRKTAGTAIGPYSNFTFFQLPHYLPSPVTWFTVQNFNALLGTETDLTKPYGRGETDAKIAAAIATVGQSAIPAQAGQAGKFLYTNGTTVSWLEPGANGTIFDQYLPTTLNNKTLNNPTVTGTVQGNVNVNGNVSATNLSGNCSGCTGIAGATGGVSNTNNTTVAADNDSDGTGVIDFLTRGISRFRVENTGDLTFSAPLKAEFIDKGGVGYNPLAYGAVGDGITDDRVALNALVNTTLSAGGTVEINRHYRISSALSVPIGVILRVSAGGRIDIDSGVTLTLARPPNADPNQQIFAFTGTGKVSLGGVDCTSGCTASQMQVSNSAWRNGTLHAAWWGLKADWVNGVGGTDNSTIWAKIIAALPNGADLVLPTGAIYSTSEIAINNRRQITVRGLTMVGEPGSAADNITSLVYGGAAGGTVLHLGKVRNSTFAHIFIDARGTADKAIYLDNGAGTAGDISSRNKFVDVAVYGNGSRPTFIGAHVGNLSNGANDEYHTFEDCHFRAGVEDNPTVGCTGTNAYIAHSNAKAIKFIRTSMTQAAKSIHLVAGSYSVQKGVGGYSNIGHYLEVPSEPIEIEEETEGLEQVLVTAPGAETVAFRNCRYDRTTSSLAGTATKPLFDTATGSMELVIENSLLGNWYHNSNPTWKSDHIYLVKSSNTGGGGKLTWNRVSLYNYTLTNLYTNFRTFGSVVVDGKKFVANESYGLGGGIEAVTSGNLEVPVAKLEGTSIESANSYTSCTPGTLCYGNGNIEVAGPYSPNTPALTLSGTHGGSAQHCFAVVAKDAAGNRTKASPPACTFTANGTLTGTNKIDLAWAASPSATSYDVIAMNNSNGGQYRLVTNTASTSYSVVANPTGSFDYVRPAFNEVAITLLRGTTRFGDKLDSTKRIEFNVSGVSSATTRSVIWPNSNTNIPIFGQTATFTGLTAPRNIALPDEDFTAAGIATTQTFTNKTIDAEATGNNLTIPQEVVFLAGINNAGTTAPLLSIPATNGAAPGAIAGSNVLLGVLDFDAATDESIQGTLILPAGWTSNIDVEIEWLAAATSGDVIWAIQTACAASGETLDPALNAAQTVTDTAQGTTNFRNTATITPLTTTGCAASERLFFKLYRDADAGGDTMAGDARLIAIRFTLRATK